MENQEDSNPEQNPVMNFFKTLVSDTIKKLSAVDISNGRSCKIRLLGENELKNCSNQKWKNKPTLVISHYYWRQTAAQTTKIKLMCVLIIA